MKPRSAIVTLAALALCLATARLGWWQLDRAAQKLELQDLQLRQRELPPLGAAELPGTPGAARVQSQRRVELSGEWLPAATVYLDNRVMDGRTGFYAVTPLRLDDGSAVLVQRGWLPRDPADRMRIGVPAPPAGAVRVSGRIAAALSRAYELGEAGSGPIRQNLDIEKFATETGLKLRPLSAFELDESPLPSAGQPPRPDQLLRDWPLPAADVHKHHGYAFQWFALSVLTIALYVWFQILRPRRRRARDREADRGDT